MHDDGPVVQEVLKEASDQEREHFSRAGEVFMFPEVFQEPGGWSRDQCPRHPVTPAPFMSAVQGPSSRWRQMRRHAPFTQHNSSSSTVNLELQFKPHHHLESQPTVPFSECATVFIVVGFCFLVNTTKTATFAQKVCVCFLITLLRLKEIIFPVFILPEAWHFRASCGHSGELCVNAHPRGTWDSSINPDTWLFR